MSAIYETVHFILRANPRPHVSRTDGGHLEIHPRQHTLHRWQFDVPRAQALMRLSMLAGEAMITALNERGIPVERLNFQDNGNWGIGTPGGPRFHLHLYGRARGSVHQKHGEALRFPLRDDFFAPANSPLEPLSDDDCRAIRVHIDRLGQDPRYHLSTWGITED
ncbi:MAG: hypothetical protein LBK99_13060 [Opitutaceae bacterium]|jgi:diadenosine tetraphosphate (Ap4A) HIT family hydrolase|nr:hypothetical protein [Opitutaceae bacterium]